jgi:hypothetical protein
MNIRRWDCIVGSWAACDQQGLDQAWTDDALPDLGSLRGQYEHDIGFGA